MIYVYTSILNGWDNLRPPTHPAEPGVRYICFTNVPVLPKVEPWEYRPLYFAGENCRTARVPKILPHLMLPPDAEYSIYHDGNLRLKVRPTLAVKQLLGSHDWAAHRHPCRTCVYDEARILLKENIGTKELIEREIAFYRLTCHPENAGLWANGFIARRHTPEVAALNERWWTLYSKGCERDQLSFPVARAGQMPVNSINANVYESPYVDFFWHAAWKDRDTSIEFHPERDVIRERLKTLARLTGSDGGVKYPDY